MSETVETILLYTIGAGLLSIVYGFFTGKNILNQSTGNAKMQDIASAIQIGAKAYLARQYKTIAIVGVVVLVIVSIAFSPLVGLGLFSWCCFIRYSRLCRNASFCRGKR
jgi:K(+)-stimulated pyrophosphate-energized sodium pump